VAAIEKATGRLVNAIVKDEFSNTKLPALKMTSVTVPQLFEAFVLASRGSVTTGGSAYSTEYGFKTPDKPSDDSIWYFYAYKAPPPAKVCRFYSLAAYLDRGFSVDDITTAIETGWRLLGVTTGSGGFFGGGGGGARGGEFQPPTSPPTISFHKDTKLLIAVGERDKLEIIDDVLKALGSSKPSHAATAPAPAAQPAETPKPEK